MIPTTLEPCLPILKYLQHTLTLPFKVDYSKGNPTGVADSSKCVFKGVELKRGAGQCPIPILVLIYHFAKFLFVAIQFSRIWILKGSSEALLSATMYAPLLLFLLVGNFLILTFHVKKVEIIRFLNKWHHIEREIYQIFPLQKETVNAQIRIFRTMRNVRGISLLLLTFLMVAVTTNPGSRKNLLLLYSVVEDSTEIRWLWAISVLDGLLILHSTWPAYCAHDLLIEGFPRSALNCLELICHSTGSARKRAATHWHFKTISRDPDVFPSAMRMYRNLENLVEEFNSIFSHILFLIQIITVSMICGAVYACLQRRIGFHILNIVIYSLYLATAVGRQIRILGAMGKVYNQSQKFKKTWFCKISTEIQFVRLRNLSLIQFQIGGYYGVTPTTILTLLSVATTYIIVPLQF